MNLPGLMSFGLLAALAASGVVSAQTKPPTEVPAVLFENVRIFDGRSERLSAPSNVLVVDGDPIADIRLVEEPAKNFVVIMKDGVIYKNALR